MKWNTGFYMAYHHSYAHVDAAAEVKLIHRLAATNRHSECCGICAARRAEEREGYGVRQAVVECQWRLEAEHKAWYCRRQRLLCADLHLMRVYT